MEQLVLKVHRVQPVPMAWMERKVRQEQTALTGQPDLRDRREQMGLMGQVAVVVAVDLLVQIFRAARAAPVS